MSKQEVIKLLEELRANYENWQNEDELIKGYEQGKFEAFTTAIDCVKLLKEEK